LGIQRREFLSLSLILGEKEKYWKSPMSERGCESDTYFKIEMINVLDDNMAVVVIVGLNIWLLLQTLLG